MFKVCLLFLLNFASIRFEMNSITYDGTRKTQPTQTFKTLENGEKLKKVYLPVPYNVGFELNVISKLNEDALQIVEQILPYFQPSFNITVDLVDSIGEKRDIPVVLDSINFTDDYDGIILVPCRTFDSSLQTSYC